MTPAAAPREPRIRTLLVDDSAVMRSLLRMTLEPQPRIEIVAAVADGREALAAFDRLHPDLVLLDIEMPGMNGLEVLTELRRRSLRVPVIMCSTLTHRGARITIEALARGATDYVAKPEAQRNLHEGVETLTRELLPKILALFPGHANAPGTAAPALAVPASIVPPAVAPVVQPAAAPRRITGPPRMVVIGVSTGGPAALEMVLPRIPAAFPLPILVVQHMPRLFTALLAERLDALCPLRVREAEAGMRAEAGTVTIARGDWHLEVERDFRMRLNQNDAENFCRPSVDVLFRSACTAFQARLLAVVLTGMGSDGLAGCRAIRAAGGSILAQDAATSVIWGMPGAVVHAGLADKTLPLASMAAEIVRIAHLPEREVVAV